MGRRREHFKPLTVRVGKKQYKNIIKDSKRNGNVGNVLRRIINEHYNHKVFKYRTRNYLTGFYNLIFGGLIMNKKIIGVIGIVAIVGMLFGLGIQPIAFQAPIEEHAYLDGIMSVHKNGVLIDRHHNTLMDDGADAIRDALMSTSGANVTWIAVGNDSVAPVAGDSSLTAEIAECGFIRIGGTPSVQGTGNWSYIHTFTSTGCAGININISAMFNDTTGGTMFWGSDFVDTQLEISDTLQITWNISVAGA